MFSKDLPSRWASICSEPQSASSPSMRSAENIPASWYLPEGIGDARLQMQHLHSALARFFQIYPIIYKGRRWYRAAHLQLGSIRMRYYAPSYRCTLGSDLVLLQAIPVSSFLMNSVHVRFSHEAHSCLRARNHGTSLDVSRLESNTTGLFCVFRTFCVPFHPSSTLYPYISVCAHSLYFWLDAPT